MWDGMMADGMLALLLALPLAQATARPTTHHHTFVAAKQQQAASPAGAAAASKEKASNKRLGVGVLRVLLPLGLASMGNSHVEQSTVNCFPQLWPSPHATIAALATQSA
jgi:hypothetical protein